MGRSSHLFSHAAFKIKTSALLEFYFSKVLDFGWKRTGVDEKKVES